ncbi:unnamed protein product, partial [marine sediment metagenome]
TYTITNLGEGSYTVYCYAPSGSDLADTRKSNISVTSGQTTTVDFTLVEGGIITGRVLDSDGNPVNNARVSASGPTSESAYTTETGTYTITNLGEGSYTVYCYAPAGSDLADTRKSNISVISGQTTTVNFILVKGSIITGQVLDSDGNPVNNAWVYASGPTGEGAYTTATGSYTITNLGAGSYTVYCYAPSGSDLAAKRESNISVISGQTTTVDFILVKGGIITGQVLDSDGNPVNNAWVYASGPTGEGAYTTETGAYTITNLGAGSYTVYCYA